MLRIYQNSVLIAFLTFFSLQSFAQDSTKAGNGLDEMFNTRYAKTYTIAGIEVTGAQSYDRSLIASISGIAVGDKVQIPGTDVFSSAINKLWKQKLVKDAKIYFTKLEGSNLYIEIALEEMPRLMEIEYIGVKKSEKEDLEAKTGLNKDRVVTEEMKLSAIEAIRKFYSEKGYRNLSVEMKQEPYPGVINGEKLTFTILKGKKVKINSINFTDNETYTDLKLKKQMKGTKEMTRITLKPVQVFSPYGDTTKLPTFKQYLKDFAFLRPTLTKEYLDPYVRLKLFGNAKLNDKKYAEDKDKILEFYNSKGFRDATLQDTVFYDVNGNANIDIKMKEGRKYYFGNITWKGNTKYSDSVLTAILGIKKGDIYNLDLLNKRTGKVMSQEGGDINSLYQDDGYLFSSIEPVETAVYNDTIDHEIRITEGPQAVYGNITVSGNEKTKDYVILREVRTVPGDKYSRSDIIRTIRELGQLGFLNAEKISPNIQPNRDNGTVDIEWKVEEKSADQLELSAGFGGGIGLTGTLGVTFNNFSIKNIFRKESWDPLPTGDGQKFSARVQANGKAYHSYNLSFTEPWLGGHKRNSFSVSVYSTKYGNTLGSFGQYDRSRADTEYVKTIGLGISLGKTLKWPDDYFNLIYSLNVQQYRLKNYNLFRSGTKSLDNGTSTNISLKLALVRSSAGPNPIFPTQGSNFMLSGQFTLPYSLMGINKNADNPFKLPEFHKWRFNGEWFLPIGNPRGEEKNKQFILRAAAKYGFIGRYNKNLDISPFERFQLGDAGMSNTYAILGYDIIAHRGYPVYNNSNPKVNPESVSQDQYFTIFNKYTAELRYPFSTNASSTIYGLAFFEAANGWYSFKDYNPFKLRRSAGVGLRFFLPMFGLLGFDYGVGFDRFNQSTGLKGAAKFTFMLGQEPE